MNGLKNQWITLALGATFLATPVLAEQRQAVLGAAGELYVVKSGTHGDLFPKAPRETRSNPVLALEITRPGGLVERLLVPGTDTADVERSPELVYEEDSHTVFLAWESQPNLIHAVLNLAGFDGAAWSKPIQVNANPFVPKISPHLLATRDSYRERDADGELVTRSRKILHMVWGEQSRSGSYDTFYTPIILVDGVHLGWNPVFTLNELDPLDDRNATLAAAPEAAADLVRQPVIQTGRDQRTVVVGFASGETRRLVTVEIDALPHQLSHVAGSAGAHIIDMGFRLQYPTPNRRKELAAAAHSFVLGEGADFYPEVARSLADRVSEEILKSTEPELERLAEKVGDLIVDMGSKFSGRGLRRIAGASLREETHAVHDNAAGIAGGGPPHLLQFRVASSRPAPEVGTGPIRTFVSEDGERVLVAWQKDTTTVHYRQSQGEAEWSEVRELKLSEHLDLRSAYEILERRVRNQ